MAANNNKLSPRQKMINLMYIVLTAMLALNVSSDVLNGFTQVEAGLSRSNDNISARNATILETLRLFSQQNPDKGLPWYQKALEVSLATTELNAAIDSFKLMIVTQADGDKADVANIVNRDDLEAASVVMLAPGNRRGKELRQNVEAYREFITSLITDSTKRANIQAALSTSPVAIPGVLKPSTWEEAKFDNQPVVAAITLLSELQNDIRYAEGETLATLLSNVDAGDVRVNELNAFVIPRSQYVMRGGRYSANIVLAAVDTTQRPVIYVNGKSLGDKGLYEVTASTSGNYDYKGYLEVPHGDGTVTRHDFASSYTVIDPTATVSATMMNVLYAGIDNPISISVPGVANSDVTATMTNGTLTRTSGGNWVARPAAVGKEAVITVSASMDGSRTDMGATTFRVRKLPNPTPFIIYTDDKGNRERYRSGSQGGIAKGTLRQSPGIEAAIDDELLNIQFKVLSFETIFFDSMGNAAAEVSEGSSFSSRQKERFGRMRPGQRFFISRVKAIGPDGITRDLAPIEVIVK